jgi:hypothetical protein
MTIKEILNQFIEKNAEANISLNSVPPSIRVGAEGNVRAAKAAAETLKKQYFEEVTKSAVLVAVRGKQSEQFAKIADENFETLSLSHTSLLDRLYNTLKTKLAREHYSQYEHSTLVGEIVNLKSELGIIQLPIPTLNTQEAYYNQDLRKSMETVMEKTYGDSLNAIYLKKQITEKALERRFDGNVLPVVIYNYRGELDTNYLPRPVQVIDLDEITNDGEVELGIDLVKSLLVDVKSKIRKPSKRAKATKETTETSELETKGEETNE